MSNVSVELHNRASNILAFTMDTDVEIGDYDPESTDCEFDPMSIDNIATIYAEYTNPNPCETTIFTLDCTCGIPIKFYGKILAERNPVKQIGNHQDPTRHFKYRVYETVTNNYVYARSNEENQIDRWEITVSTLEEDVTKMFAGYISEVDPEALEMCRFIP
jgi:hypothetical protein